MKATLITATILSLGALTFRAGIALSQDQAAPSSSPSILSVDQIVSGASSLDAFRHPSGLFVDKARSVILVADRGNHRLVLFDVSGRCRGTIPFQTSPAGEGPGEPLTLAADTSGNMFVVNALDARVSVLTARGSRLGTVELPVPAGTGSRPQSVDVGLSGSIYLLCGGPFAGVVVTDHNGHRLEGQGLTPGTEPLGSAVSLAVNEAAGLLCIVSPLAEKQVRLYGLDGRLRAEFGAHGDGEGTFSMAAHVAWGPGNTLWITDTLRHSISVFDARGTCLGRIGGFGRGPGQFNFPVACGFLSDDRLVVLERGSARFQILAVHVPPSDTRSLEENETIPFTMQIEGLNSTGGVSQ
jgi:hypothetical protein